MKKLFLFFTLIFTALAANAGLFDKKQSFLKVDDAFAFSATLSKDKSQLQVHWDIADGYYLYQDKIRAELVGKSNSLTLHAQQAAELHQDPYFGEVKVFTRTIDGVFSGAFSHADDKVEISYQGCTEGFCYPPETKVLRIGDLALSQEKTVEKIVEKNTALLSEPDRLADSLFHSKWAIWGFFLLGVGLAFTPCVLPMLPLLSAIVIGQQQRSMSRAFILTFLYVQGMALTYTLLGLAVAAIGLPFQIALQHPYVMVGLSILFVVLALSMFGLFTIQLPNSLQNKLNTWSQKQTSGAFGGSFAMGMIAGLVASPCTSAPLSGALLYVAQSGDLFTGAATLYLLALGMGVPLMLITLFGNKILPKSGEWMNTVKQTFGFVMLALPVFLLSRILPEVWEPRLWAGLATAFFIWFALQMPKSSFGYAIKIISFALAMVSVQPLQNWIWQTQTTTQSAVENKPVSQVKFKQIKNIEELDRTLAENSHSIAMLDLYADWCVACKEFEKLTFSDPKVQQQFQNILLLQVNMTKNSPENKALMERFNVMGLPTILFFDKQNNEIQGSRVTGFMDANSFSNWIEKLF